MTNLNRRSLITGLISFAVTAPAIVRAASLMPVKSYPIIGWDLGSGDSVAIIEYWNGKMLRYYRNVQLGKFATVIEYDEDFKFMNGAEWQLNQKT